MDVKASGAFVNGEGGKGGGATCCTLTERELKRRVAQRHLPLIKFDGHLGNCCHGCCIVLLMWVSGACGIIILTGPGDCVGPSQQGQAGGRVDGWQVQLRQRQRQQAQFPRCKRCQFVVNQMLEASPSCRRDAAAGKVPRMPAGGGVRSF